MYLVFNLFNPEPRSFGVGDGRLRWSLDVNRIKRSNIANSEELFHLSKDDTVFGVCLD